MMRARPDHKKINIWRRIERVATSTSTSTATSSTGITTTAPDETGTYRAAETGEELTPSSPDASPGRPWSARASLRSPSSQTPSRTSPRSRSATSALGAATSESASQAPPTPPLRLSAYRALRSHSPGSSPRGLGSHPIPRNHAQSVEPGAAPHRMYSSAATAPGAGVPDSCGHVREPWSECMHALRGPHACPARPIGRRTKVPLREIRADSRLILSPTRQRMTSPP